jgi:hypothetical protein
MNLKEKNKLQLICYEIRKLMVLLRFFYQPLLKLRLMKRGVAQLVAYLVWDQRVVSSSLATPTIENQGVKYNLAPFFIFLLP